MRSYALNDGTNHNHLRLVLTGEQMLVSDSHEYPELFRICLDDDLLYVPGILHVFAEAYSVLH